LVTRAKLGVGREEGDEVVKGDGVYGSGTKAHMGRAGCQLRRVVCGCACSCLHCMTVMRTAGTGGQARREGSVVDDGMLFSCVSNMARAPGQ
jgi:hypothetical protein